MRFSSQDIQQFADWSGDQNPLHVDEAAARRTVFGQTVVHGMLSALHALSSPPLSDAGPLRRLDIEFRSAIFPETTYSVLRTPAADGVAAAITAGDAPLVALHVNQPPRAAQWAADTSWTASARAAEAASCRRQPAVLDVADLRPGHEITARYQTGEIPAAYSGVPAVQARVLALCSYLVGMELPGLRSLFTRLTLNFEDIREDSPELLYRARIARFDPHFRILDLRLDVATADGRPVASGDVRAYVRFSPIVTQPEVLAAYLSPETRQLEDRVVLVCGGSRGLGAELSAALAMAGCHVYASFNRDGVAARELAGAIEHAGAHIELLEGDAGDVQWCAAALATITARHGRLDAVVLNACAPPASMRLAADSAGAFSRYIEQNLRLAQVPVAVFLPTLAARDGSVVCISSSFVTDPPAGFGHYVALKQAVEATVQTAVRESTSVRGLIARPPRLQTSWNDTPTGVLGTIPASHAAVHIVNRLAAGLRERETAVLSDFPELRPVAVETEDAPPDFTIALAASFTADPILDGVKFWFSELGLRGAIEVAPYGQVLQTLLNPSAAQAQTRRAQVVLLRVRDWLRELPGAQASSRDFVEGYLADVARDFERAMRTHRAQSSTDTLLVICPSAAERPGDEEIVIEQIEAALAARLNGLPGLTVLRAQDYHATYGVQAESIADHVREHIAHIPYQSAYFHTLATLVMRHLHRKLAPARKVVVVDCDNTLWRGVVGEVGAEGVAFDDGHVALHQTLARLNASGVLIALCSKNEESDVWRVFETRPDFGLSRDLIVAAMINWLPKSQNLKALAARLNLGLDSLIFIDDNPVECAEVRSACPEILTLEWPPDAERATRLLQHTWELDPRSGTAEDQRRTELYREEFRRQEAQAQTLTFRDFIASLELQVDIAPLSPADLKRSSQLTLRTNQFNFTTKRRDEGELQALVSAGTYEIRTVTVRDRFGDYGLVGLLIAEPRDDDQLAVDTFLLSCRVLGRGVEHAMAAELGRIAVAHRTSRVRLRVVPTKRNTPARTFLESIVPAEFLQRSDGVIDADLPAEFVSAIRFEPADQAPPVIADDGGSRTAAAPADASRLRARESQIFRTAFELATPGGLASAIDGRPAASDRPAAMTADDATAYVYEAFASALGLPSSRVREIDSLEALGCGSFKIVEITVHLLEKFPRLPGTLLFEHRSVSEIAARIAEISKGDETPAPAAAAASLSPSPASEDRDIAVVGMHLRCAGAQSPDELWDLLSGARIAVTPVPPERPYFLGELEDDRPHFAGLLDNVDRFDADLFGITPREAELMDPQLRLFLEVAWAALEDAGALGDALDVNTGVFAGVMYGDYAYRANLVARHGTNPFKSWEGFSLANRLSQIFGFRGPSLAVDTACSSSATAVHLACRALQAGDCSVAIAGGVNLILDPDRFVQLGRLGILSLSGRCLAFGAEADGTILGEGAGVVVLRPLADALRRGDRIYGVIKATGVSTGSGTVGFTAPNPLAQAEAIRRAVRAAGIDPRTVSCVETHGTGTTLGDPIEVRGLTLAYTDPALWDAAVQGAQSCAIGSIKPNIGHLEAGAGVLGLIKVLLQVSRGMLLPSVTSAEPNPQIPFSSSPFFVQRTLSDWRRPVLQVGDVATVVPRRGAINSFGVGGANAHIIVEEAPSAASGTSEGAGSHTTTSTPERPSHILAVSARSEESLHRRLNDVATLLEEDPALSIGDVCFTANTGRRHLERRVAVVARTSAEMAARLRASASAGQEPAGVFKGTVSRSAPPAKLALLFTGQGSQYAGMGRALYDTQPEFRQALDECFDRFEAQLGSSLRNVMFAEEGTAAAESLNQTGYTQPALFTIEYALWRMWRAWGIRPDAVVGHSVGEITAMCAAGGISLDDAVRLIAARGRLMQALPSGGAMTSIMAPEARVVAAIAGYGDRVSIAAVNGPAQIVISGEAEAVDQIATRLRADGVKTKSLVVSHAFHSALMRPMLASYEEVVRTIRFSRPEISLVSGVHGRVADAEILEPAYWLRNVADAVRFTDGMRTMDELKVNVFLEAGPQPVLIGMGRQCVADSDAERLWLASIRKDSDPWASLLSSVGSLYTAGVEIDWTRFDSAYARRRVTLPAYPFARKRHWIGAVPSTSFTVPQEEAAEQPASVVTGARAYDIAWRKHAPHNSAGTGGAPGHWLIFADSTGIGAALARVLEAQGARCTVAACDDHGNAADPGRILAALESAGTTVRGVVYLWALDTPMALDGPATDAIAAAERGASLMRAVAAPRAADNPLLWIVTSGAATAENCAQPMDLSQSSLWGLGRTFALEHPSHWGGLIDVSAGSSAASAAESLAREILAPDGEDQIAIRPDGSYVPRLVPRANANRTPLTISSDGTYLITGGLGALGLHVARWLASNGARRLILTGRRGLDTDGAAASLRELEAAGAAVTVLAADISRPADVDAVLAAASDFPPLVGVFHAAGVDETRPVSELAPGDFERVMGAKARGAWLLHERTRTAPLHIFACFSSIASVLGSAGRPTYAAANAFLDALAHQRRLEGLPGLSVNWGPWAGGGMATDAALQQYERVGNRGLEPAQAMAALQMLLETGAVQSAVADIEWGSFRTAYEARRSRPFISELTGSPQPSPAADATAGAPWVQRLSALPSENRVGVLAALLRGEVAQTLGFETAADVPLDQTFHDMGMDSLMSADFAQRLQKRLGIRSTALVFEYPYVETLAKHLLDRLALAECPVAIAATSSVGSSEPSLLLFPSENVAAEEAPGSAKGPSARVEQEEAARSAEGYSARVEQEVFDFQMRAWPARRRDWIAPRWKWMFVESAQRLGIAPQVWLHRENGSIVGHNGAIPVRVRIGNEERLSAWLVDTMVLEEYRSQAVGARLMLEAHEDLPFALSLGQTEQMRAIQLRLGWEQIAPLQTAQLLIRPERVLKGKLPGAAALAAGLGLRASSAMRDVWKPRKTGTVRKINLFGEPHDELWTLMARDITCAVRRDASYLNWKYVDQPGQDFLRLELSDANGVRGVVVCMFREPDDVYKYCRAFIVDLVAPLSDGRVMSDLIQVAVDAAAARGADALLCLHVNPLLTTALRQAGFRLRQPSRFLLVRPGPLEGRDRENLLAAAGWYVTQGDSDIDRPW